MSFRDVVLRLATGMLQLATGVLLVSLAACGGGSQSGGTTTPPTPAPSGLSYPTPQTFTVGQAITSLSPTVTGSVSSYSVSPTLPTGLTINATTGVISGTPTAVTPQASYTVTATNTGGTTTASISIAVNGVAPTVAYQSTTIVFATGVPIGTPIAPVQNSGGSNTTFTISPALPAGLNFGTDGTIRGTPTAASAAAAYTVTATLNGAQSTVALTISVQSETLLDLGHASSVSLIRFDGTHVVSVDTSGHWVLWNYATAALIASGDSGCTGSLCAKGWPADVKGSILVVQIPTGFELRSATDGHLISTIPFAVSSWNIATDGSYFSAQGASGLSAWSPSGTVLFSRTGDYSKALAYASPTELLVAAGALGANVIETINVASTTSTPSPAFSGNFTAWFQDGARFVAAVNNNTVLIYSKAAVQQEALSVSGVTSLAGGISNWFWVPRNDFVDIYAVGGTTAPVASFAAIGGVIPSATTLGLTGVGSISVVDFSGATPTKTDFALPIAQANVFAASSATNWLTGNAYGVVLDGASLPATPRYFGYGQAWSIKGSASLFAISTASGRILYFDSATKQLQGTIQDFSAQLQMSADGTVLAAQGDSFAGQSALDQSLRVFSLPSGNVLADWPYVYATPPVPLDISLSGSGTVLGQVLEGSTGTDMRQVSGISPSSAVIWSDSGVGQQKFDQIRLSPDGTLIAPATGPFGDKTSGANIIKNGTLVTAVLGWPLGWLDNNRLIVNTYDRTNAQLGVNPYQGAVIYDATGKQLATSAIPELHEIQPLTADTIYSPELNTIYSVSSGAAIWSSGYNPTLVGGDNGRGVGAVAGGYVVFETGPRILALSH